MRNRRAWGQHARVLLALLAFWAAGLRGLGTASFWYDEIFNADLALNYSTGGLLHLLRTAQPYPPLYLLLLKGWSAVTGAQPYAPGLSGSAEPSAPLEFLLRFPSVAAALLALAAAATLGRRSGLRQAWAVPLLLALHPTWLEYARDARMYPLWTFLVLVALLGLTARRPLLWALAGSAALLTHYFSLFPLLGAVGAVFVLRGPHPIRRRGDNAPVSSRSLLWLGLPFLPAALWALWALPVTAGFHSFATSTPPTLPVFLEELGGLLSGRGALAPLSRALSPAWHQGLLAAGALGLLVLAARRPSRGGVPLAAFLIGAGGLFAFWQVRPVHHPRYLFWGLPLLAMGLVGLLEVPTAPLASRRRAPWEKGLLTLLVGIALLWAGPASGAFLAAPRTLWYPDFRETVAHMNQQAHPNDRGLAVAGHALQVLQVYHTPVPFAAGPEIGERMRPEEGASLLEAHRPAGDGRYWVLLYQDEAVDPSGVLLGTLEQAGGYRVAMVYTREARLFAYALPEARPFRPLSPDREVHATFEGGILLHGASLHREGRLLVVYLFWELTAPQSDHLTGAVHLVRRAGERPITQQDRALLNDYWPLPRLPLGEVLPHRYELIVPLDLPPGTYRLYALLYNPVTGERRRVVESEGCTECTEEMVAVGTLSWP